MLREWDICQWITAFTAYSRNRRRAPWLHDAGQLYAAADGLTDDERGGHIWSRPFGFIHRIHHRQRAVEPGDAVERLPRMGVMPRREIGVRMDNHTVAENVRVKAQGVPAIKKCENSQQQHRNQFVVPVFHSGANLAKTFHIVPST